MLTAKRKTNIRDFKSFVGSDPGWGTEARRAIFRAACQYLGIKPSQVENILGVGFHSLLQSDAVLLKGEILEKVKLDPTILREQNRIIVKIKGHQNYKTDPIREVDNFAAQLGGDRARAEMWKQALEFWKWAGAYSATWEMAFNELTWTVRSVRVKCFYEVKLDGKITLNYSFSDVLDLRPSWGNRSLEYNAACFVLGFIYHDVIGGSDELKLKAKWTTTAN